MPASANSSPFNARSSATSALDRVTSLLIATTNQGKLREIEGILEGVAVRLLTLNERPTIVEPDEIGTTFEENARQKASYYARGTGELVVKKGGEIVIVPAERMPTRTGIAAIYRF